MTIRATEARLVARTTWVDDASDLVVFAGDHGLLFSHGGVSGLAARGVARHIAADTADATLASIEVEDGVGLPGCGALAIGALPFTNAAQGQLVIPRQVLGREPDGRTWRTTISAKGGAAPNEESPTSMAEEASATWAPDEFSLCPAPSHEQWCDAVALAVAAIREERGALEKVVLSRQVVVEANRAIRPAQVAARLGSLYPSCMVFSIDGFVGASPELLVSRRGDDVWSQPLAGTIPRSGDPDVDRRLAAGLLASAKERQEHALVVAEVAERLHRYCTTLSVPSTPDIVPLRNVSHLGTRIGGRLRGDPPSALALALDLHPTPAVAGSPTSEALAFLDHAEPGDRGRYAGPVGWVDARGDGDWAVAIRCAELAGHRARLYAGAGVVADSTPAAELAETQLKFQALLAAVVRP